ncbi:MAG: PspC domain-containing protein [Cellulosilyticaceae bacterium]
MNKGLERSSQEVMLAGVCGGLAHYFNLPATNVRILWFIMSLFGGLGVVLYIGLALIVPQSQEF